MPVPVWRELPAPASVAKMRYSIDAVEVRGADLVVVTRMPSTSSRGYVEVWRGPPGALGTGNWLERNFNPRSRLLPIKFADSELTRRALPALGISNGDGLWIGEPVPDHFVAVRSHLPEDYTPVAGEALIGFSDVWVASPGVPPRHARVDNLYTGAVPPPGERACLTSLPALRLPGDRLVSGSVRGSRRPSRATVGCGTATMAARPFARSRHSATSIPCWPTSRHLGGCSLPKSHDSRHRILRCRFRTSADRASPSVPLRECGRSSTDRRMAIPMCSNWLADPRKGTSSSASGNRSMSTPAPRSEAGCDPIGDRPRQGVSFAFAGHAFGHG